MTLALDVTAQEVAAAASEVFWIRFDTGQVYWERSNLPVNLEGETAVGEINSPGWWALATPAERARGCVVGRVETPAGAAMPGAEVAYQEEGAFGHHRAWADANGRFCANPLLNRASDAWVFAMERDDLRARFSASVTFPEVTAEGSCDAPSTCVDAGTLVVTGLGSR